MGLSGQSVRALINRGELDTMRTSGGKYRITKASIEAYIAARQVRPASQDQPGRAQ